MASNDWQTCNFFVTFEPEFSSYTDAMGNRTVRRVKPVSITQKPPSGRTRAGSMSVGFKVRIPSAAFLPITPQVVIEVPESLIQVHPLEVEATDGSE
jgi:hypothetical protein